MVKQFEATGTTYTPSAPLVVAEIGTGHGGDISKALDLVDAAAEAGAGCAKFQCIFANEIVHPNTGVVPLPSGDIPIYERFRSLELDEDFYATIKEHTEARKMIFLCTPFGLRSARLLRKLGVSLMKVASPELNHLPLIDELASYGLPVLVSSGVSTLADIERALRRLATCKLALLHCVTAYPAPAEEYNLRLLAGLSRLFGLPVGVSDHSLDPVLVPTLAIASGASVVEKHICLSRSDPGLDDPIALPPSDFARMTASIREAAGRKPEETIAAFASEYGAARIEAVLGDGVKRLAPSEAANYRRTNRSIHALKEVTPGDIFSEENLAILRTEKILRPGLGPEFLGALIGRRARRGIPSGEGIVWEDVGDIAD